MLINTPIIVSGGGIKQTIRGSRYQNGNANIVINLPSPVDASKCIVLLGVLTDSIDSSQEITSYTLTNTTLTIVLGGKFPSQTVFYEIFEFENVKGIQKGVFKGNLSSSPSSISISSVNIEKSLLLTNPLFNVNYDRSGEGLGNAFPYLARLNTATTIYVYMNKSICWNVVEFE